MKFKDRLMDQRSAYRRRSADHRSKNRWRR